MNTVRIFAKMDYIASDGTVPLYLRLTCSRKVHPPINLDLRCRPADWDSEKRLLRSSHPLHEKLNLILSRTLTRAQEILLDHQLTGRQLTYDSFVKEFAGLSPYNFYDIAADYQRVNRGVFSAAYQQKVTHVTDKLREFAPQLELHQVDYNFIRSYIQHLTVVRKNSKNTIHSNLRIIRRIFGEAVKQELIKKNPFDGFRLEKSKVQREALDLSDIKALEKAYLIKPRDQREQLQRQALAFFLLAIYSGRRYQDLQDFHNWKFYPTHIKLTQQKQIRGRDEKKDIILYMNEKLRSIVSDIKENNYKAPTNMQANSLIKKAAAAAGIDKTISFHIARHTFAAINKKLTSDLTVRRDLLGHDSIKSTLIYDHADQELLGEVMRKWDSL